jgi:alpha-1,3-fucosyltransferase
MRINLYSKVFFYGSLATILLFIASMFTNYRTKDNIKSSLFLPANVTKDLVYILEWTLPNTEPFVFLGDGQDGFIRRQCKYTNCFVTNDRQYLSRVSRFDAILFHGPEIRHVSPRNLPKVRSSHQKYIFASIESSHYYPMCSNIFDGYFNWTWTFRLDSDSVWGYIVILDTSGNVVGPNKIMHWKNIKDMEPVKEEIKEKLKTKTVAAAWFVSNCKDLSGRLNFANNLNLELKKFKLQLDVYGKCGELQCSIGEQCEKLIADNYYFYLAFENSYSEDYVTEKLLLALKNYAVPIIFGGANYTR